MMISLDKLLEDLENINIKEEIKINEINTNENIGMQENNTVNELILNFQDNNSMDPEMWKIKKT